MFGDTLGPWDTLGHPGTPMGAQGGPGKPREAQGYPMPGDGIYIPVPEQPPGQARSSYTFDVFTFW